MTNGTVIELATRCASADEFIERFARFTTRTDVWVPALSHVRVGTHGHFLIRLADRSTVMQGRCDVMELRPLEVAPAQAAGPPIRALMRLRLREMDAHSWGIHLRLMERLAKASAGVVAAPAPSGITEPTEASPAPPFETAAPGASDTLPANPLSELNAADLSSFIELTLIETSGTLNASPATPAPVPLPPRRRAAWRVVPYVSCVVTGLLLGIALRPVSNAAPAPSAPTPPPPQSSSTPLPTAEPELRPPPAPRACTADISTEPAGAAVTWGGVSLGRSPIARAQVPCGTSQVTVRHERYAEVQRTLAVDPDETAELTERLHRAPAKLLVTSSPPHVQIRLNHRRLGAAPRQISTVRYEHLNIEASLPGYRPWKKRVYLRQAESQIDVVLVPASR